MRGGTGLPLYLDDYKRCNVVLTRNKTNKVRNRNWTYLDTPKGQLKRSNNKASRREAKAECRN